MGDYARFATGVAKNAQSVAWRLLGSSLSRWFQTFAIGLGAALVIFFLAPFLATHHIELGEHLVGKAVLTAGATFIFVGLFWLIAFVGAALFYSPYILWREANSKIPHGNSPATSQAASTVFRELGPLRQQFETRFLEVSEWLATEGQSGAVPITADIHLPVAIDDACSVLGTGASVACAELRARLLEAEHWRNTVQGRMVERKVARAMQTWVAKLLLSIGRLSAATSQASSMPVPFNGLVPTGELNEAADRPVQSPS